MKAEVATADVYDVVVDGVGSIWVRTGFTDDYVWSYLTDEGRLAYDVRDRLPVEYEPYLGLDHAAATFVTRHLKCHLK